RINSRPEALESPGRIPVQVSGDEPVVVRKEAGRRAAPFDFHSVPYMCGHFRRQETGFDGGNPITAELFPDPFEEVRLRVHAAEPEAEVGRPEHLRADRSGKGVEER